MTTSEGFCVEVEKDKLAPALKTVLAASDHKSPIFILGHILLDARGGELQLVGTDSRCRMECLISADVNLAGAVAAPAAELHGLVSRIPAGAQIRLELKKHRIEITDGRGLWRLPTLPAEDFPPLWSDVGDDWQDLPKAIAREVAWCGHSAAAVSVARHYLQGVYIAPAGEGLRIAATNSRRLQCADLDEVGLDMTAAEDPDRDELGIIFPIFALPFLAAIADEALATIQVGKTYAGLGSASTRFYTRLVDGKFPAYQRILPTKAAVRLTCEAEVLRAALARTGLTGAEAADAGGHRVTIWAEGGLVWLVAEHGDALGVERLPTSSARPIGDYSIGFATGVLAGVIEQFTGEVTLAQAEQDGPAEINSPLVPQRRALAMPHQVEQPSAAAKEIMRAELEAHLSGQAAE